MQILFIKCSMSVLQTKVPAQQTQEIERVYF